MKVITVAAVSLKEGMMGVVVGRSLELDPEERENVECYDETVEAVLTRIYNTIARAAHADACHLSTATGLFCAV
jgi:hypothetical protein